MLLILLLEPAPVQIPPENPTQQQGLPTQQLEVEARALALAVPIAMALEISSAHPI